LRCGTDAFDHLANVEEQVVAVAVVGVVESVGCGLGGGAAATSSSRAGDLFVGGVEVVGQSFRWWCSCFERRCFGSGSCCFGFLEDRSHGGIGGSIGSEIHPDVLGFFLGRLAGLSGLRRCLGAWLRTSLFRLIRSSYRSKASQEPRGFFGSFLSRGGFLGSNTSSEVAVIRIVTRFALPRRSCGADLELVGCSAAQVGNLLLAFRFVLELEAPFSDEVFEIPLPNVFLAELDEGVNLSFIVPNLLVELVNAFLRQRPDGHAQEVIICIGTSLGIFFSLVLVVCDRSKFSFLDCIGNLRKSLEIQLLQLGDKSKLLLF